MTYIKKIIGMITIVSMMVLLSACGTKENASNGEVSQGEQEIQPSETKQTDELLSGLHHATIEIQDYGTISVELDADKAPISVTNFLKLAQEGFYDGLTFHRIIEGFMMQGGDGALANPVRECETIKGEFQENGWENDIAHKRGVISMARTPEMDSASSQFFIMHQDSPHLDGKYAAFGWVTEGMDIVDEICSKVPVQDDNGKVNSSDQPVIVAVKVVD